MKKVFIIGFNRTATKALHNLFKNAGYSSAHYSLADPTGESIIIAKQMVENLRSYKPLMHRMDHIQVFSDMFWHREDTWIDGNKFYHELHCDYPDAHFIMNTRDMDEWLNSKRNHKEGAYIKRCMEYHQLDEQYMLDWFKCDREHHEESVRKHFLGYDKFIEFDVNNDPVSKLINFLKPNFFLKESAWVRV